LACEVRTARAASFCADAAAASAACSRVVECQILPPPI
jgi:hypothetical protein